MNIINEVNINDIDMKPFKVKNSLHHDFFNDDMVMDSQIRLKLLDVADDFIKSLEVKWVKPEDIVITGSIVNYNWSKYSDVDVHIIYDYSKVYKNSEFVQDYFMAKRDVWNNSHQNLSVKGFPVEISVEDSNAPLQSSGVYSLEKNEWVKEPKDMDDSTIDKEYIKSFCAKQMTKMDKLFDKLDNETDRQKLENLSKELEELIDYIHDKRKSGLKTKQKEMSNGNIIWKVIKHNGYAEKAYEYINKVYDRRNTIDEAMDYDAPNKPNNPNDVNEVNTIAKNIYGVTTDPRECGYILTDGTMLNFSEAEGHGRSIDHISISHIEGVDKWKFINMGNIRFIPEGPGFALMHEPTDDQYSTIMNICEYYSGRICYVDIMKYTGEYGQRVDTIECDVDDTANELINYYKGKQHKYKSPMADFMNEGHKVVILTESQMREINSIYSKIGDFLDVINNTMHLNGYYRLKPNNNYDKQIAFAAFAEAGFKNIGNMKGRAEDWIKKMTLSDANRVAITNSIKRQKDEMQYSEEKELRKPQTKADVPEPVDTDDPTVMQNFIDRDDISDLNESK